MTSAAHITIAGDGRPMVTMGAVDLSGTRTTMAQVVAEEFGLPHRGHPRPDRRLQVGRLQRRRRRQPRCAHHDRGAGRGQRAMRWASCGRRAAEKLQCRPEELDYARRRLSRARSGGAAISLAELMQATLTDGAVVGRGVSTKLPLGVEIGAHVCDVEVDTDTGLVTVLRYTAFQDVGLALNPTAVEGQMEGSVVQGLGWALTGRLRLRRRTGACATPACSTTACRPRSTCRASSA